MSLRTLLFVALLIFPGRMISQPDRAIRFELGGSGGIGSLNYEQSFLQRDQLQVNWRTGISFAPIDRNNGTALIFPVMAEALVGKDHHFLNLGLGQGITLSTRGSFLVLTTAAVGYRFFPSDSPWFFTFSYTPLISYLIDFQVQNWGGISIGYQFSRL